MSWSDRNRRENTAKRCETCSVVLGWMASGEHCTDCKDALRVAPDYFKPGMSAETRNAIVRELAGFERRVARGARKVEAAHTRAATALTKANMRGQDASRFRFTFARAPELGENVWTDGRRRSRTLDDAERVHRNRARVLAKLSDLGLSDRIDGDVPRLTAESLDTMDAAAD